MRRINLKGLEMDCYRETLQNGLEVYLIPYENKKNYFISYGTHFGSDILEYTDSDKVKHTPPLGIAHFLEHKMFEQESGEDPFAFFAESGTDSNAYTSFDSTQYICYGTKDFSKNLRYLLSFVDSPYYTDQNVKKEKGIIAEEIKMYNDMPDFELEMKLRECLYKNHPRRLDIAGTVEEIEKITKEDLYSCYNNFYVPNNMFVLIVGYFNKEEAMRIIEEEMSYKKEVPLPKMKKIVEPEKVNISSLELQAPIEIPKLAFGLKISTKKLPLKEIELDLYLKMFTTMLFGSSSLFRERVRNEKIASSIETEWESIEDFHTFYLQASTQNPDLLEREIKKEFKNCALEEKDFTRIQKVWIANEVRRIDNIDDTVNSASHDIIKYKEIIPNRIDLIKKMKFKTLKELISMIHLDNTSVVKSMPNKKRK